MNDIAFAATIALLLSATGASAQTPAPAPDACPRLQLGEAECRNLAAEQAKERSAQVRPAPRRPGRDPALGKRESGTIKQGDTVIQYRAM